MTPPSDSGSADRAHRPLRLLQPRPPGSDEDPGAERQPAASLKKSQRPACERCRIGKVRCDGRVPAACSRCSSRRFECIYLVPVTKSSHDTLKRKYAQVQDERDVYKQLFETIRKKSAAEAEEIVWRIQSGTSAREVVRQMHEGDLLLQLHLVPESRILYTLPSLRQIPTFLLDRNPYAYSVLYRSTEQLSSGAVGPASTSTKFSSVQALVPFHAAEVVDSRFNLVRAAPWTTVITNDKLFARLLQLFFQFEYPQFPHFQKDCFLDDMVAGRHRFCSSLLVNAVLAAAWHCNLRVKDRAAFWDPQSLQYQLLAECRRLFELETGPTKLTTVQATTLLTMVNSANACDEVGDTYIEHAVKGALVLGLFSEPDHTLDKQMQASRAMTAWAVFGMQALHKSLVCGPPLVPSPPPIPLPDPESDSSWYGEIWLLYPASERIVPMHFGHSFRAMSKFRVVLNDFAAHFYAPGRRLQDVTLDTAMAFRWRIMECYNELPNELSAINIRFPHQLRLHMHYYKIIILMFESVVAAHASTPTLPRPIGMPAPFNAAHILNQTKNCLEVLIRLYFLHHDFSSYDLILVVFLSYVGYMRLKELPAIPDDDSESKTDSHITEVQEAKCSMLALAAKGLHHQIASTYLAEVVFRMFHENMAARKLDLPPGLLTLEDEQIDKERDDLIQQNVRSALPVGVVGIAEDFEKLRLSNLVKSVVAEKSL